MEKASRKKRNFQNFAVFSSLGNRLKCLLKWKPNYISLTSGQQSDRKQSYFIWRKARQPGRILLLPAGRSLWWRAGELGHHAQMWQSVVDREVRVLQQACRSWARAPGSIYLHFLFAKPHWAHPLGLSEKRDFLRHDVILAKGKHMLSPAGQNNIEVLVAELSVTWQDTGQSQAAPRSPWSVVLGGESQSLWCFSNTQTPLSV